MKRPSTEIVVCHFPLIPPAPGDHPALRHQRHWRRAIWRYSKQFCRRKPAKPTGCSAMRFVRLESHATKTSPVLAIEVCVLSPSPCTADSHCSPTPHRKRALLTTKKLPPFDVPPLAPGFAHRHCNFRRACECRYRNLSVQCGERRRPGLEIVVTLLGVSRGAKVQPSRPAPRL